MKGITVFLLAANEKHGKLTPQRVIPGAIASYILVLVSNRSQIGKRVTRRPLPDSPNRPHFVVRKTTLTGNTNVRDSSNAK